MKRDTQDRRDVVSRAWSSASHGQVEAARSRVFQRLRAQPAITEETDDVFPEAPRLGFWSVLAAVAAVAVAVIGVTMILRMTGVDTRATAKTVDGTLFRIVKGESHTVQAGEKIGGGALIRSDHDSELTLADGSLIEMRSKSELAIEAAGDGVRIRLNDGSVIVTAAKQRTGHLYVQTKDVTVSVVGTVFFVNAGEEGSRVAVIQGEVHVQQDGTSRKLLPGEQVASNPSMVPHPVAEEISWSRSAPAHMALLLQQSVVPAEPTPAFEVVSVRPSASGPPSIGRGGAGGGPGGNPPGPCGGLFDTASIRVEPQRFIASTTTLYRLIALAYGKNCRMTLESDLVAMLPPWIKSDHFDIQAIIPEGTPVYTAQQLNDGQAPKLQMMIQSMLADRFKIALHRDMKELPVYNLVMRSGKIKLSEDQTSADPEVELARMRAALSGYPVNGRVSQGPLSPPRGIFSYQVNPTAGKVTVSAVAIPMLAFMNAFQGSVGRPVIDKTEIKGLFDIPVQTLDVGPFDMVFGPSVWPAIVEQIGFKLEPGKASVEILMIDHVEKPSDN
jgi:uncharacterized protein (TIGR03435 family)